VVETRFADEVEQALEAPERFAGKAHDQRRAQRDVGHEAAGPADDFPDAVGADAPVHGGEHCVVDMLDGQIDITADGGMRRHGLQKVVGDVRRMGVKKAQPVQAVKRREIRNERSKGRAARQVATVGGRILADENDFPGAAVKKPTRFGENVAGRPAAGSAPDGRYGAVGAAVGTAVGDFQIGGGRPRRQHALMARRHQKVRPGNDGAAGTAVPQALQMADDPAHLSRADEQIRFGKLPGQLSAVALGEAACDHQLEGAARLFPGFGKR